MSNRRRQGNMIPEKVNSHTIEDLADSEGNESSVSEVQRMMIRMFKKLKEDIEKNSMNPKRIQTNKIIMMTQEQLNKLKEDLNEHQNESKKIILKKR
jgi:hypothetical protein